MSSRWEGPLTNKSWVLVMTLICRDFSVLEGINTTLVYTGESWRRRKNKPLLKLIPKNATNHNEN